MKNVICLVDGMWNVAVKKAKRWSGHTSKVCEDEWDTMRLGTCCVIFVQTCDNPWNFGTCYTCWFVDSLLDGSYMFIRAVEAENYLMMDAFECDNSDTFRDNGLRVVPRLLTMTGIHSPSSRPRPRGSTRRPFGSKKHDFSDSTWWFEKKNMNNIQHSK